MQILHLGPKAWKSIDKGKAIGGHISQGSRTNLCQAHFFIEINEYEYLISKQRNLTKVR